MPTSNQHTDKLINNFRAYLETLGLSENSLVNYISDVSHFASWMIFKARSWGISADSASEVVPLIGKNTGVEYREFLVSNNTNTKTANRRLSSLRKLAQFFTASQILDFDFMSETPNVQVFKPEQENPILLEFQRHLEAKSVSKNTIKNYLSDIRQFLSWLEQVQKLEIRN